MDFVEQLKSSIDIVEVVGQYVRLRKAGTRHIGLCPFHTEKTPSFGVHAVHQFYKCFGCGAGGDVIKFVMEIEGLTFYEALKALADRHGIPMPKRVEYSDPETKLRAALHRMHEIACDLYRRALASSQGAEARAYLARRGVATSHIEEFDLGYAESSGHLLARAFEKEGFPPEHMEASGLVLKRQEGGGFFDRFRGRLMFPIHNERGDIIAFGGRALAADQDPKYLNSSETEIYHKKRVLYNLHRAKQSIRANSRVVLVEGYMDVIGVWAAGVREVVATCGTALVSDQVRSLRRHSERIVVNFDPDQAGVNAAERSIQLLLEEGMRVRVLELEGGLDPDEFVKAHGAERYRECVAKAPGYFHWLADRARARFDMSTAEGRVTGLGFMLPAIQRVNDKLERAAIAEEVAGYLSIDRGLVLENFRRAAAERREKTLAAPKEPPRPVERILLNALLASSEVRRVCLPRLKASRAVEGFATRGILQALAAVDETRGPLQFTELEARLGDADRELLASVVFADKPDDEEYSLERALACLEALERSEREADRAALKARIKQAERAGMLEEALRITEELGRLEKA
jgi:DNA primase